MFEKEAEEYAKEKIDLATSMMNPQIETATRQGFKDGAEFGYNKANEEIDYLNKHWRSEEERKANEWHYVKDKDLPKENQLVLLYRENPNGANVALAYWCKSYVNDKVIAWKEIVLPKESE